MGQPGRPRLRPDAAERRVGRGARPRLWVGEEQSRAEWPGCLGRETDHRACHPGAEGQGLSLQETQTSSMFRGGRCEWGEGLQPGLGRCPGSLRPVGAGRRELELASGAQGAGHGLISTPSPTSPLTLDADPRHLPAILTRFQPGVLGWPLTCLGNLWTKLRGEQALGWVSASAGHGQGQSSPPPEGPGAVGRARPVNASEGCRTQRLVRAGGH